MRQRRCEARGWLWFLLVPVLLPLISCTGAAQLSGHGPVAPPPSAVKAEDFGDPTNPAAQACALSPIDLPIQSLQRLTAEQYLNTARALFDRPAQTLTLEMAHPPIITALEVEKLQTAAEQLIATGGHLRFSPCSVTGAPQDECMRGFIRSFGLRAFRRPPSPDEEAWLMRVYEKAKGLTGLSSAVTFKEALDVVAQVMVQAPQHVYLRQEGTPDAALPEGMARQTGYERATGLSYLLTQSMPDEALFQAAAQGELDAPEGVRRHAERLLNSASGRKIIRAFAARYLDLDATTNHPSLEANPKDLTRFAFDSPALRSAMRKESEALYEQAVFDSPATFERLLTGTKAYVNKSLAALYGVPGPTTDTDFAWVELGASQRSGLLTRAAFLTQKANQRYQSPIHRGVHLYRHILCQTLGPPPPNANDVPVIPGGTSGALSTRQLTEVRTAEAGCQACHAIINPLGFALEHYDAMGKWQDTESGTLASGQSFSVPVNSAVELKMSQLSGPVSNGVELSKKLAQSEVAQNCLAQTWLEQTSQRAMTAQDTCSVMKLQSTFRQTGDLRALILDAASATPALYVRVSP